MVIIFAIILSLQKTFNLFGCFRIGLGTRGSRLNYEEFLRAFEDGRKEHYQRPLPEVRIQECDVLSPQEAETKLRQIIENQGEVLGKVCVL
jgi:hypothetical protein